MNIDVTYVFIQLSLILNPAIIEIILSCCIALFFYPCCVLFWLGIHRVSFEAGNLGIPRDVLAGKVLPFLLPLSMDSSLSLSQVR